MRFLTPQLSDEAITFKIEKEGKPSKEDETIATKVEPKAPTESKSVLNKKPSSMSDLRSYEEQKIESDKRDEKKAKKEKKEKKAKENKEKDGKEATDAKGNTGKSKGPEFNRSSSLGDHPKESEKLEEFPPLPEGTHSISIVSY